MFSQRRIKHCTRDASEKKAFRSADLSVRPKKFTGDVSTIYNKM